MENISNHEYWKKKTFLITTNKLKLLKYADKVLHTKDGKIDFVGTPNQFKKTPQFRNLSPEGLSSRGDEENPFLPKTLELEPESAEVKPEAQKNPFESSGNNSKVV